MNTRNSVLFALCFVLLVVQTASEYSFNGYRLLQYDAPRNFVSDQGSDRNAPQFGSRSAKGSTFRASRNNFWLASDLDTEVTEMLHNNTLPQGIVVIVDDPALSLDKIFLNKRFDQPIWFVPQTAEVMAIYNKLTFESPNALSSRTYELKIKGSNAKAVPREGSVNLVTILKGSSPEWKSLPTVVVTAHYDTLSVVPGFPSKDYSAASGAAAVVELARLFSRIYSAKSTTPYFNLVFALTTGGSVHYAGASHLAAEMEKARDAEEISDIKDLGEDDDDDEDEGEEAPAKPKTQERKASLGGLLDKLPGRIAHVISLEKIIESDLHAVHLHQSADDDLVRELANLAGDCGPRINLDPKAASPVPFHEHEAFHKLTRSAVTLSGTSSEERSKLVRKYKSLGVTDLGRLGAGDSSDDLEKPLEDLLCVTSMVAELVGAMVMPSIKEATGLRNTLTADKAHLDVLLRALTSGNASLALPDVRRQSAGVALLQEAFSRVTPLVHVDTFRRDTGPVVYSSLVSKSARIASVEAAGFDLAFLLGILVYIGLVYVVIARRSVITHIRTFFLGKLNTE